MSRKKNLLEKIRRNPRNVSLREFESLARQYGYIEEGSKHPRVIIGNQTLIFKRESRVKTCYVKELLDIIDSIV
jgi:hypothetical protein